MAQPPHFGQVEHLAQHAEGAVRLSLLVCQLLHQRSHVRTLQVLHLHPAHDRDDAAVNHALIAALRAGLVTLLGVVLHEGVAELLHGRCLEGGVLGRAGVAALAHLGQPLLRHRARLIDGQLPVLPQSGLAAFSGVRTVLEHEHLAACRSDLAQEAGHHGISQFDGLGLRLRRIDSGLGELDFRHDDSSESPVSKSRMGATRGEAGSSFGKHRHMLNSPKLLINLL